MLLRGRVDAALQQQRESLHQAAERTAQSRNLYRQTLDRLARLSSAAVAEKLGGVPWPGARPTSELDERGLFVRFKETWQTAQEARAWALNVLRGAPTVAVDGSQIVASPEFGVPVSLVQVAWFENYHEEGRPYVKDVRNLVLAGDDATIEGEDFVLAESRVFQCRYTLEMETAAERLAALPVVPTPVVFVDGTFVLSFAGRMQSPSRDAYFESLFRLLDASERNRVPVIGYVDLSRASDLATMLRVAFDLPAASVGDPDLLDHRMAPFDRTAVFECARGDVMPFYRTSVRDYSADISFVYLKTGRDRPPARIDVPRWVVEAGLLDRIVDVVRAEVVVGSGYPYALETADAAAVLTMADRMQFFAIYQEFARLSGLPFSLPAKSVSKSRRR